MFGYYMDDIGFILDVVVYFQKLCFQDQWMVFFKNFWLDDDVGNVVFVFQCQEDYVFG